MKKYNQNLSFIYKKPCNFTIIIFLYMILFLLTLINICSVKIYSKKVYKGIYKDNQIIIPINVLEKNVITKSSYMKIGDVKKKVNILKITDVYNNGSINLQDVVVSYKNNKKYNNEVVDITFYYDYDYKVKKIVRGVLE